MKKVEKLIILSLILLAITTGIILSRNSNEAFAYEYQKVSSEIVINKDTKEVLHAVNESEKASIASLTKILTAITAIEYGDVEAEYEITKDMVGVEGSSIYLQVGERLTLKELLYGLMLRSGNDAATAIAIIVAKDVKSFAFLMNEVAKKAGAKNSNFVNPHGLEEKGHYSTAEDLALISAYALNNDLFAKIVSTKNTVIRNTLSDGGRYLKNKNKILDMTDGANGIKTGYTKYSGRCLASSATRNGTTLICIVINCPNMFERSVSLLDSGFEKYSLINGGQNP